jgi:hypothetical protein
MGEAVYCRRPRIEGCDHYYIWSTAVLEWIGSEKRIMYCTRLHEAPDYVYGHCNCSVAGCDPGVMLKTCYDLASFRDSLPSIVADAKLFFIYFDDESLMKALTSAQLQRVFKLVDSKAMPRTFVEKSLSSFQQKFPDSAKPVPTAPAARVAPAPAGKEETSTVGKLIGWAILVFVLFLIVKACSS